MATELDRTDKLLQGFLEDMISELVLEYDHEIVSIALFGSATTKEWVKGKSDIDFIVVVAHKNARKKIESSLNRILLELDKKHELQLTQTCSIYVEEENPILSFFYKIESLLMFGRPFFVFSSDQIRFDKGIIKDSRIRLVTAIFDPLSIFLAKMKQTGVTIYGIDLIKRIQFSSSAFDKVRIAFAPIWLVVMSLLSFPVDELFALKHSIKATIWASEDALFALDVPLSTTAHEVLLIAEIFGRKNNVNIDHLRRTVALKNKMIPKTNLNGGFVARHILNTIWFIMNLYYSASVISRTRQQNQ